MEIPKQARVGIPPAFSQRCAVRCVDSDFGDNSKGNPMITVNCELIGFFDDNNQLQTEIERGGQVYKLAGIKFRPIYFTLTEKAVGFYKTFWEAAHPGEVLATLDETNPDREWLDGLVMQALVSGTMQAARKQLTDEEKEELKAAGKPAIGEPILDEDGNKIETPSLVVSRWLKPFKGELPTE